MTLQSLTDLLLEELAALFDAENQLIEALPLMAQASFSPELQKLFEEHVDQTRIQVDRLEKVFRHFKVDRPPKHCLAMAGLIKEAQELLSQKEEADPSVLDAALITAAQKVEHYEIAGYGVFGPSPAFSESRMSKSCYKILSTKKNLRTKSSPLQQKKR